MFDLPVPVVLLLSKLHEAQEEAYVIGGCVRDYLMQQPPHDFDIATSAAPQKVVSLFQSYAVHTIGIAHGTVRVVIQGMPLEVTTYRRDGDYCDYRHPSSVQFTSSLKEDMMRRDFTMNAMAYAPTVGVIDYFQGREDINASCIRCIGDPQQRFQEDALRMLRALRFASCLGFAIEAQTAQSLSLQWHLLANISVERQREELLRMLAGNHMHEVAAAYGEIISRLLSLAADAVCDSAVYLRYLPQDSIMRFAVLLRHTSITQRKAICQRWKLSKKMAERLQFLAQHTLCELPQSRIQMKRWLCANGLEAMRDLLAYRAALAYDEKEESERMVQAVLREIVLSSACYKTDMLQINGHILQEMGIVPGKGMKALLAWLLAEVIEEHIENDEPALRAAVLQYGRKELETSYGKRH